MTPRSPYTHPHGAQVRQIMAKNGQNWSKIGQKSAKIGTMKTEPGPLFPGGGVVPPNPQGSTALAPATGVKPSHKQVPP